MVSSWAIRFSLHRNETMTSRIFSSRPTGHLHRWGASLMLGLSSFAFAQAAPEAAGKALVDAVCNTCHVFTQRVGGGYTPQGWETVLRMMTNHGLNLSFEQLAQAKAYLSQHYPEKPKAPAVLVDGPHKVTLQAWQVPTPGSRPHDPLGARDGSLWYTGQLTGKLGRIDPNTGAIREYSLKSPHTGPHGLMEDARGNIWYTGNAAGLIGVLNPQTGQSTEYPMPDPAVKDPHTLLVDAQGIVWFTAQNANRVGRLDPATGQIQLLTPPTANSRPYGIMADSKGMIYYVAFGTNKIARVDPKTLAIHEYTLPNAASRPRRLVITPDDTIWYADFSRGYLGHLDPKTGQVDEVPSPSGPRSQPYGMSVINGVIWYSESGTRPGTVVRFDPATKAFQSWPIPGGGDIVRNTSVTPDGNFVLANSLTNEVTLVRIGK
jgi:virginiamycin B lyase